jgi:hypothetical protein
VAERSGGPKVPGSSPGSPTNRYNAAEGFRMLLVGEEMAALVALGFGVLKQHAMTRTRVAEGREQKRPHEAKEDADRVRDAEVARANPPRGAATSVLSNDPWEVSGCARPRASSSSAPQCGRLITLADAGQPATS